MKKQPFPQRLRCSLQGIRVAFRDEASFRTQVYLLLPTLLFLLLLRPAPHWWALFGLTSAGVLSLELVNTALEALADRISPEVHPLIQKAKDCASAAVLIMSIASLGVLGALLWQLFRQLLGQHFR